MVLKGHEFTRADKVDSIDIGISPGGMYFLSESASPQQGGSVGLQPHETNTPTPRRPLGPEASINPIPSNTKQRLMNPEVEFVKGHDYTARE